ncbi:MAG: hypothetical protein BWX72_02035 [Firmicutes bacterium ADurb.Bin080]|jgi:hypothetical protein|nr:hypothetical protein [Clostridiales bacterium]OQC12120.1 MAG: hypothetical protein BWX72_02035 [Firmicutes bacterium ADurb.Bin080]
MLNGEFEKIPLGDIKPKGWLLKQLEIQAEGLSGNVMDLFKDLSLDSAWLGGKGESWERGPYYIDGLMPLAYLLNDTKLIKMAKLWIDSILNSQDDEGFFGPKKSKDWWPRMVVTKMLPDYFEATSDERVIPFLKKYYHYMNETIENRPFFSWASVRAGEELIGIRWLFQKTGDKELLELARKILIYRFDWKKEFANFRWPEASKNYYSSQKFNVKKVLFYAPDFIRNIFKTKERKKEKTIKREQLFFNQFYHVTHGVNIAMALKYPILEELFTGEAGGNEGAKEGFKTIMDKNGTSISLFTCDEHLSGYEAFQGTELCTVAESMFSAEKNYEISGDRFWADLLEKWAYNAFPATFTPDMCAHQYVQQTNQISATTAKRTWYDSYNKSNIYGLKPNYACCLSNMHQGFPKFAEHIAYKNDNAIILVAPIASEINTRINNKEVSLSISSEYPFRNNALLKINKGNFDIQIQCPEFAESIVINGEEQLEKEITIKAYEKQEYRLEYNFKLRTERNPDSSISLFYGPLLMALPIKEKVTMGSSRFSDREMDPCSEWRYGLNTNMLDPKILYIDDSSNAPFGNPNITVEVTGKRVNWKIKNNQCDCMSSVTDNNSENERIKLVPYGATNLRISQFPEVR